MENKDGLAPDGAVIVTVRDYPGNAEWHDKFPAKKEEKKK